MRKASFLFRKAPYGSVNVVEGFRLCTAFAAMEIETNAIFIDDGVFVALKGQDPKSIGIPAVAPAYTRLRGLNVNIYLLEEALRERGIAREDLVETEYVIINMNELAKLIAESDFTLSF